MGASGVGEKLQRERLRNRLSLEDVSAATKISVRFLKAIEAEDFEVLPGLIFSRNFVKQYAGFLKLDPAPLLELLPHFDLETAPLPQPPARPPQSSWDPRWNSTIASAAWILLAGGAAIGAYVHFNKSSHPITTVRAQTTPPKPAIAPEPPKPAPVVPPESASVLQEAAATSTADTHHVRVALTAREDAWVQATADGKTLFATTLKAGETRPIDADQYVKIRTGNAGGIDISLNGKTIDSLGPVGQIRTVTLTAEGPHVAPVAPANPDPRPEPSPL